MTSIPELDLEARTARLEQAVAEIRDTLERFSHPAPRGSLSNPCYRESRSHHDPGQSLQLQPLRSFRHRNGSPHAMPNGGSAASALYSS